MLVELTSTNEVLTGGPFQFGPASVAPAESRFERLPQLLLSVTLNRWQFQFHQRKEAGQSRLVIDLISCNS